MSESAKSDETVFSVLENSKTPVADAFFIFQDRAALWDRYVRAGETPPLEVMRDVFACAELVLRIYISKSSQSGESFPITLAHLIANQIKYIAVGKLPNPIEALTGRGPPGVGFHEGRDRAIAVAYIKAARAGLINDSAPVTTVCRCYGVTDGAARKWQRKYDFVEIADFYPGVTDSERASLLVKAMKLAGKVYRLRGRGTSGKQEDYFCSKQRP